MNHEAGSMLVLAQNAIRWNCTRVAPSSGTPALRPNRPAGSSIEDNSLRPLRKGDMIDVTITRIGYGGSSVGQITSAPFIRPTDFDLPVYAPKGACPGDVVRCFVTRVRRRENRRKGLPLKPPPDSSPDATSSRSYVEAVFTQLVSPSAQSETPVCSHFGHFRLKGGGCGGCASMQMSYDMQLGEKNSQMKILFSSLAEHNGISVKPIIPCAQTLEYRNKMEFTYGRRWYLNKNDQPSADSFSGGNDSEFALGLHAPQRFDKVIEISKCYIQPLVGNEILGLIRRVAPDMLLEPYDAKTNRGYLRHVAIRSSTNAVGKREIMVNLITSPCEVPARLVPLAEQLIEAFPDIVCVVQNIRGIQGIHVTDEEQERLLVGKQSYIEQSLCGLTFRISANSFFQTNPKQAAVLFNEVRKAAQLSKTKELLDLFCGTGTIGLCLASEAKHVYGVEVVASAIADARINAASNGIQNASFSQVNLEKIKAAKKDPNFFPAVDVIVVDPPRAGLHPDLIAYLSIAKAQRIVYVSCNPMTQLRDIKKLMEIAPNLYRISSIQPVDMFPHSHHVECVTRLERL